MTASRNAYERVARRLADQTGYQPPNDKGDWLCPAHDDNTPSLSVTRAADRVLIKCHVGCGFNEILGALDLGPADLFDSPKANGNAKRSEPDAIYPYVDEQGTLLFQALRFGHGAGKTFKQRRPDGHGGWIYNMQDVRRVLYRLPDVVEAVRNGQRIFVVEGEKDVEAIERAGGVATCNPMGAGKWRPEYSEMLAGADEVVVVADRDDTGRRHAEHVAATLYGKVGGVVVAEAKHGKDAADHLAAGYPPEEFEVVSDRSVPTTDVAGSREPIEDDEPARGAGIPSLFRRWTMRELLDAPRTFEWLVRGMFVRPTYGMTAGEMKTLKSYVSMFTAVSVAAANDVFGQFGVDRAAPVVIYVGEGGRIPYTRRLERVAAAVGVDELADLPIYPMFETAGVQSLRFQTTLQRDLDEIQPGLVLIDPLYSFHGSKSDAKNLYEEGDLLNSVSQRCTEAGAVLDIVNHFNQGGTGETLKRITMAGGGEWVDTWRLLSHRETADVPNGRFKLRLTIGSRQWGGSEWDLDLNVGRFDHDTGEYDGPITYDIRKPVARHDAENRTPGGDLGAAILDVVRDHPWELTKSKVIEMVGGNKQKARAAYAALQHQRIVDTDTVHREEGGRMVTRKCVGVVRDPDRPTDVVGPGSSEPA